MRHLPAELAELLRPARAPVLPRQHRLDQVRPQVLLDPRGRARDDVAPAVGDRDVRGQPGVEQGAGGPLRAGEQEQALCEASDGKEASGVPVEACAAGGARVHGRADDAVAVAERARELGRHEHVAGLGDDVAAPARLLTVLRRLRRRRRRADLVHDDPLRRGLDRGVAAAAPDHADGSGPRGGGVTVGRLDEEDLEQLGEKVGAEAVGRELQLEPLGREAAGRGPHDARVVPQHVQLALPRRELLGRGPHAVEVVEVEQQELDAAADRRRRRFLGGGGSLPDRLDRLPALLRRPSGDVDAAALPVEHLGEREADAGRAARDEEHLAILESHVRFRKRGLLGRGPRPMSAHRVRWRRGVKSAGMGWIYLGYLSLLCFYRC